MPFKLLMSLLVVVAAQEGYWRTLNIGWSNVGLDDSQAQNRSRITDVQGRQFGALQNTILMGAGRNQLSIKGYLNESVTGGNLKINGGQGNDDFQWGVDFSDICKPHKISVPQPLGGHEWGAQPWGELDWAGLDCPMSAGNFSTSMWVTLSPVATDVLKNVSITLCLASCPAGETSCQIKHEVNDPQKDLLCFEFLPTPTITPPSFVSAVSLDWKDFGNDVGGHITDVSPSSITLGQQTQLTVKGHLKESVNGGSLMFAYGQCNMIGAFGFGDMCKPGNWTMEEPSGEGCHDWNGGGPWVEFHWPGLNCPLSVGDFSVPISVMVFPIPTGVLHNVSISLCLSSCDAESGGCLADWRNGTGFENSLTCVELELLPKPKVEASMMKPLLTLV